MTPIKVLLADDQALLRSAFRVLVDSEPDMGSSARPPTGRRPWNWPARPWPTSC